MDTFDNLIMKKTDTNQIIAVPSALKTKKQEE